MVNSITVNCQGSEEFLVEEDEEYLDNTNFCDEAELVGDNEDSDDESIDLFPTFPPLVVRSNDTHIDDLSFATTAVDTCKESVSSTEDDWQDSDDKIKLAEVEEICMKVMTVSHSVNILKTPNIFIGDSGASNHSTQYGEGIINRKKGNSGDSVMVGSGRVINATVVGDLPGTICDKYGTEIGDAIMQEIAHCPNMRCNVFSVTKLQLILFYRPNLANHPLYYLYSPRKCQQQQLQMIGHTCPYHLFFQLMEIEEDMNQLTHRLILH